MDFDQLKQYLNDFSASIREIGDKTGNAVFGVQGEINNLNSTLNTTNILLGIIAFLLLVNIVLGFVKKNK